jgi:glycerol-3-phosphate dehydrogenase (NAD(P)+)
MNVGVVGLGNLGTAIANLIAANGCHVIGWEYNASVVEEINAQHSNSRFLPGVVLSTNVFVPSELVDVFRDCETVFVALPSAFIKRTLDPVSAQIRRETLLISLAKGIDSQTGLTSFQMISALLPNNRRVMLSGPSIRS